MRLLYRKGWQGLNLTEEECFTKKREKRKSKRAKVEESDSGCTDTKGPSVKPTKISIRKTQQLRKGQFKYDIAATHHTTYKLERLSNTQHNLHITLKAHDRTEPVCTTK